MVVYYRKKKKERESQGEGQDREESFGVMTEKEAERNQCAYFQEMQAIEEKSKKDVLGICPSLCEMDVSSARRGKQKQQVTHTQREYSRRLRVESRRKRGSNRQGGNQRSKKKP